MHVQLTKHGANTIEFGKYYFLFADRTEKSSASASLSFSVFLFVLSRCTSAVAISWKLAKITSMRRQLSRHTQSNVRKSNSIELNRTQSMD